MPRKLPLEPGQLMPVEVYGKDQGGRFLDLKDLAAGRSVLLYFYPLDERREPPRVMEEIERRLPDFERMDTTVVGIRGPPDATEAADLTAVPFPLLEDRNYEMGQAIGLFGDSLTRERPRRGLVLLDPEGRVQGAWREEGDPGLLEEVEARLRAP